mgnify:CR=1 FL=1
MASTQCYLGLLDSRWPIKKLETVAVDMPERIDVTIFWDDECASSSFYSLYPAEIYEIFMNYYCDQVLLFTFFHPDILKEWLCDVFCREPFEVEVDNIKF